MTRSLSDAVCKQLERLRATWRSTPKARRLIGVDRKDLPEPIREFIEEVEWPEGYELDRPFDGQVCIDFAYEPLQFSEDMGSGTNKQHFMTGITCGGGWVLTVRLDDSDPTDPMLYVIDHETPETPISDLSCRLSKYLESLVLRDEDEEPPEY